MKRDAVRSNHPIDLGELAAEVHSHRRLQVVFVMREPDLHIRIVRVKGLVAQRLRRRARPKSQVPSEGK